MCDSWDLCEDLDLRDVALLVLLSFTAHSSSSRLDLNTRDFRDLDALSLSSTTRPTTKILLSTI
ncbi:hypothetical protein HUJ05_002392 [Dendroctonus ponderosae]|nr:hypothetical protein HUJ05_002392 [Dendroctonus ponderosae]